MTIREALGRVLGEAGSASVQTALTPSEVVERARRRRRAALAWRSVSAAGAAAVVVAAAVVAPGLVQRPDQPGLPLAGHSSPEQAAVPSGGPSSPVPLIQHDTSKPERKPAPPPKRTSSATPEHEDIATERPSAPPSPRHPETSPRGPSWGTAPETGAGDATAQHPARLIGIRTGKHETFGRVVFDFDNGMLPAYDVRYLGADERLSSPGSGRPVTMPGDYDLEITFHTMEKAELADPDHPAEGASPVLAVRYLGGYEQIHTAALSVRAEDADQPGFRVLTLHDPARLVVDIARTE